MRVPIRTGGPSYEPQRSIRIDSESTEFEVVSVVAVAPTWRCIWAILRGRYRPLVQRRKAITLAGANRAIKDAWTGPRLSEQLYAHSPLMNLIDREEPRP